MNKEIKNYNNSLAPEHQEICNKLANSIQKNLKFTENKIWHRHPVWFIDGNPIVGYSVQKSGVRLMFWSGQSFDEPELNVHGGKFKDASIFYNSVDEINEESLVIWLKKSESIQWDYKNLIKRRGELKRLD